MAAVLEELKELIALMESTGDSMKVAADLVEVTSSNDASGVLSLFGCGPMAETALERAGILSGQQLLEAARDRALVALGAVQALSLPQNRWRMTLTVPAFMREVVPKGRVTETKELLGSLVATAELRVILAAPFLDPGLQALVPPLVSFIERGGDVLVITRNLRSTESPNRKAVEMLRQGAAPASGRLVVRSWEEKSLGIHLKVLVVDSRAAYVGSANFTWGGLSDHYEMGVHLTGEQVQELQVALEQLAGELVKRSHLSAR